MKTKHLRRIQHALFYLCTLKGFGEPTWSAGDEVAIRLLIDHIKANK